MTTRPRVGVSACLLGEPVRYDGGHKRSPPVADLLAPHVELVPVCPEVELGLGTPREPIQLVRFDINAEADAQANADTDADANGERAGDGGGNGGDKSGSDSHRGSRIRLVGCHSGRDHTEAMQAYAERKAEQLAALGLSGYILKARSPSCGLGDVPLHDGSGAVVGHRDGLFAAALRQRLPWLVLEDETRLADPQIREHFLARLPPAAGCEEHPPGAMP